MKRGEERTWKRENIWKKPNSKAVGLLRGTRTKRLVFCSAFTLSLMDWISTLLIRTHCTLWQGNIFGLSRVPNYILTIGSPIFVFYSILFFYMLFIVLDPDDPFHESFYCLRPPKLRKQVSFTYKKKKNNMYCL